MRFFEARPLLHEIGCALGKAHNVFHLKGVLRRPLETTQFLGAWEPGPAPKPGFCAFAGSPLGRP